MVADNDAYEDDENVAAAGENKQENQPPTRKKSTRDRIAAQARTEDEAAKAAENPVFFPHATVCMHWQTCLSTSTKTSLSSRNVTRKSAR